MLTEDEARHQLALLARRKRARVTEFSPERPTVWKPWEVRNPGSGETFTEAGAWEFIVACLEEGQALKPVPLDHPPGKTGYAMTVPGGPGAPDIYIKLELGSGKILGRSFHYSRSADSNGSDE